MKGDGTFATGSVVRHINGDIPVSRLYKEGNIVCHEAWKRTAFGRYPGGSY